MKEIRIIQVANTDGKPHQVYPSDGKPHCQFCGLEFTEENQVCKTCGIWQVTKTEEGFLITPAPDWKEASKKPENRDVVSWCQAQQ